MHDNLSEKGLLIIRPADGDLIASNKAAREQITIMKY